MKNKWIIFIFYCSHTLSENRQNSLLNLNNLVKKDDVYAFYHVIGRKFIFLYFCRNDNPI